MGVHAEIFIEPNEEEIEIEYEIQQNINHDIYVQQPHTMLKEFKQLDAGAMPGTPVVGKVDPDFLSFEETKRATKDVNLIMEKRNDTIHKCNTDGTLRDHNKMDDKQRRAIHGIWSAAIRID